MAPAGGRAPRKERGPGRARAHHLGRIRPVPGQSPPPDSPDRRGPTQGPGPLRGRLLPRPPPPERGAVLGPSLDRPNGERVPPPPRARRPCLRRVREIRRHAGSDGLVLLRGLPCRSQARVPRRRDGGRPFPRRAHVGRAGWGSVPERRAGRRGARADQAPRGPGVHPPRPDRAPSGVGGSPQPGPGRGVARSPRAARLGHRPRRLRRVVRARLDGALGTEDRVHPRRHADRDAGRGRGAARAAARGAGRDPGRPADASPDGGPTPAPCREMPYELDLQSRGDDGHAGDRPQPQGRVGPHRGPPANRTPGLPGGGHPADRLLPGPRVGRAARWLLPRRVPRRPPGLSREALVDPVRRDPRAGGDVVADRRAAIPDVPRSARGLLRGPLHRPGVRRVYASCGPDGTVRDPRKGHRWKAAYHPVRAGLYAWRALEEVEAASAPA